MIYLIRIFLIYRLWEKRGILIRRCVDRLVGFFIESKSIRTLGSVRHIRYYLSTLIQKLVKLFVSTQKACQGKPKCHQHRFLQYFEKLSLGKDADNEVGRYAGRVSTSIQAQPTSNN
jgi:hypothetical protein